jgi:hypothetical protein
MRILPLVVALLAVDAGAVASHCSKQEQVIFSCAIAQSRKVVSLCASRLSEKGQEALTYRFGPIGKVELEFPRSPAGSLAHFRYAHYLRFRTDRTEVSFSTPAFKYSLFDYHEAETGPARLRGVRISSLRGRSRDVELMCAEPAASKLGSLGGLVPCDAGNPLAGCG